jgi:acetyl esterase
VKTRPSITDAIARTNLWLLPKARDLARSFLRRRDRDLPDLRELRNFSIPGPGGDMAARLYCPMDAPEAGPLLVYFHGGGFLGGDLDTHDALCWRLAEAGAVRVLSCLYRLAPEHPWPAQLDDAMAAARWALAQAMTCDVDPTAIALGGDSAGGYLALAAAKALNDEAPGTIRAQVLLYPLMHLDDEIWSKDDLTSTRPVGRLAVRYIGELLVGNAPSLLEDGALAPLPTLVISGGRLDPCRADALACAEKLRSLGAPVVWREYAEMVHGFGNLTHLSRKARLAVEEIGVLAGELLREAAAR